MANDKSSSNRDIRLTPGAGKRSFKPNDLVAGMTKDTRKRWLLVLGGICAATIAVTMLAKSPSKSATAQRAVKDTVVDTSPRGLNAQKDWRIQTSNELSDLRKELERQQKLTAESNARLLDLAEQLKHRTEPRSAVVSADKKVDLNLPPPPAPPKTLEIERPPQAISAHAMKPVGGVSAATAQAGATPAPVQGAQPKRVTRAPARAFVPPTAQAEALAASAPGETAIENMVANDRKGFLPGGSFVDATLISGVEAFTGGTAQSQPQPLVVRLDKNAILPNSAKYDIKGCHVLVSAWGDLSSERVYARLATLTCVDAKNRLVLSEEVEGVLVDSDGKNGIRGTLQDRQGAKLARSLLAGFAQGVSAAFGSAQSTVTNTALGSTSTILGKNIPRAGAYQGASTAAEQLTEFYMKQAEATMPVIVVDAGRRVSVLFTKSKALKFETTDMYRADVKPRIQVERKVY